MANIRQIAKLSGYSVSSVSRVLNNHPHVSDEAREKILQVIRDLDYTPNILAKELSLGQTHKVGVVISHTRHPYFTQLLNGLLDAAQASQHQLVLLPSQYNQELELSYLEQLRGHAFDSLIFTSRSVDLERIASYVKYGNIVCCEKVENQKIGSVYVNREPAYLQIYQYLKEQDFQNIALLLTRAEKQSATYRHNLSAYQKIYGKNKPPLIFERIANTKDAYKVAPQLAASDKIDCIFTNGDDVAAGVIRYYQEHGLSLPLTIGQENQISSQLLGIPTVDNKSYQLGQAAFAQALAEQADTVVLIAEFINR